MTEAEKKATRMAHTVHEPSIAPPPTGLAPPGEAPDPYLGQTLKGLYRIERRIGVGGMGSVYAATHVHLGKQFAIKLLSPSVSGDPESVDRLRQEAVLASSIDHDNIVQIISLDTAESGAVFIVMELLTGMSLAALVHEGPVPAARALQLLLPVCSALAAAHARGIIHRDLKPENIFLSRKSDHDVAKVLDFGISKVKEKEAEQVRLTRTGQLVGTPLYMSPEQAKGDPVVDHRADIYSLGVILYEMVTGTPPFTGGNYFQLLWKHGNEVPESAAVRAPALQIPQSVSALIDRMLAKKAEDRFDSMDEVAEAMGGCLLDLGEDPDGLVRGRRSDGTARSSGPRSSTPRSVSAAPAVTATARWPWAVALVGAAVLAVAVTKFAGGSPGDAGQHGIAAAKVPAPVTKPQPVAAAKDPAPVAVPELVEVSFTSTPAGATVTVDGEALPGVTPVVARLPITAKDTEVRLSLSGYQEKVMTVDPAGTPAMEWTFVRAPRGPGRPSKDKTPQIRTSY